jgi:hypothetical protein
MTSASNHKISLVQHLDGSLRDSCLVSRSSNQKHILLVLYQGRPKKKTYLIVYFSAKNTCVLVWRIIFGFQHLSEIDLA